MLRSYSLAWSIFPRQCRTLSISTRLGGQAPVGILSLPSLSLEEHHRLAENWVDEFQLADIPTKGYEVSYSRSSGPGGQHVNKTNSKATIRCDLTKAQNWLPRFTLSPLSRSANYLSSPPTIQISSQESRSAPQNLEKAVSLLHQTIVTAARSVIVGATSEEQRARVKWLIRAEEGRRKEEKMKRKGKKESRGKGGWD